VVDARRPRFLTAPDPRADEWALLSAVAGRHGDHALRVRHADGSELEVSLPPGSDEGPAIAWNRLTPTIGRIAIHSFGDPGPVARFDQALAELSDVRGLVLDLRSNSGGDTAVALPMIGRLLSERVQYAWMATRHGDGLGERWPEYVDPRGETVTVPVVVVVDRFTVSMGEGFAMALQETGRAKIVGTPMGGLGAAIGRVTLRKSKISAQISTEPIWAADGTPRDDLVPDVVVDPTLAGDPFLAAAVAALPAG
jgi:carboxyl-terminal processing protease